MAARSRSLDLAPGLAVMGAGQGLVMSPLIRVVLSDVPVESAGAGSGVLTTTQQTSLALGVAIIGSAYISLAPAGRLGPLDALSWCSASRQWSPPAWRSPAAACRPQALEHPSVILTLYTFRELLNM